MTSAGAEATDTSQAGPAVFVAGSSAGAHLAAMAALTGTEDTQLAGAICLYGFYTTPTWIDREPNAPSAPIELIRPTTVPFFVAHGELDSFVPIAGARRFVEELRHVSRQAVVYAELPGGQHTFDLYHSLRFEAVVDGVEAFAAWVRSRTPRPQRSRPEPHPDLPVSEPGRADDLGQPNATIRDPGVAEF
jgi:acetyl esterase/lipase